MTSNMKPPNFLVIITDQQQAEALSCAGNADVRTPHLDRLAATGVRFRNSYCTYPMCVPSRRSMLTGKMPNQVGRTGPRPQDCDLDLSEQDWARTLGRLLEAAGYRCGWGGKWHVGLGSGSCYVPDRRQGNHGFETICPFDDNALPEACEAFFQQQDQQPFFLVASFDNPHNIGEFSTDRVLPWCEGSIDAVAPAELPNLPANFPAAPLEPEVVTAVRQSERYTVGRDQDFDPLRWRQERHGYYQMVEYVDAQIGQVVEALERAGHAENTVVIFTSDHGEMLGAHQLARKWVLYEESVKVPFIVCDPNGGRQGITDNLLISNGIDLLPTLCEYARIEPPDDLPGVSLVERIRHGDAVGRDQLIVETDLPGPHGSWGRMVRTARYAYHLYGQGRRNEQLFDLENDPGQMVNLAVQQRYRDVLDAHRRRLADWCKNAGNRGMQHYARPGCVWIPGLGWITCNR